MLERELYQIEDCVILDTVGYLRHAMDGHLIPVAVKPHLGLPVPAMASVVDAADVSFLDE